jgi:Spy/CpxP family protein refolding chaperone
MKSNRESFKSQFQSVLTADQQARLEQIKSEAKTARQNHQKFDRRNAMKSLNLTDAQKSQLKTLHQQGMSQMKEQKQQFVAQVEAVLNPTQKATFEQMMSRHHGPRGHKPQQAPKSEQE